MSDACQAGHPCVDLLTAGVPPIGSKIRYEGRQNDLTVEALER
jgi:hypothetical protein